MKKNEFVFFKYRSSILAVEEKNIFLILFILNLNRNDRM